MPRPQGQIIPLDAEGKAWKANGSKGSPKGSKWKVRVYIGSPKGTPRYKNRNVNGTYKQAEKELHKLSAIREDLSPNALARKPLETYAERYLAIQGKVIRGNTLRKVKSHLESRIIPVLGKHKLERLRSSHITSFLDTLAEDLSPETSRNVYKTLKAMLNFAVSEGVLKKSPCPDRHNLPQKRKAKVKAMTLDQLTALLSHCEGHDLAMLTLLASAGLRPCELRPLRWTDLNTKSGYLKIDKSADVLTNEENTPKTDLSYRQVHLPASTLELLKGLAKESDYIFHDGFGEMIKHKALQKVFTQSAKKASIEGFTLYSLRHTHITQLLLGGTPVNVVAERVGDRPERILGTYSHVIQGADVLAAKQWESIVSSSPRAIN